MRLFTRSLLTRLLALSLIGLALALRGSFTRTVAQSIGPVAAFGFSERSGTSTVDGSGSGNTGTLLGPVTRSAGYFGNGVSLDGASDSKVQVPMSSTLWTVSRAFTLEAWVYPTDVSSPRPIIGRGDGYLLLYLGSEGKPVVYARLGSHDFQITSPVGVTLNNWTHLAATYNGATLTLLVDAKAVASTPATGPLPAMSLPYLLGKASGGTYAGGLDEIRIYARGLIPSEVALDRITPVDSATPFQIGAVAPADHSVGVLATPITVGFTRIADPATVSSRTIELRDSANALVPSAVSYTASTNTATLTPGVAPSPLADYTVRVVGGSGGVRDGRGNTLAADLTWTFRTAAASTSPVAAYAFSESAGATTFDGSGNGNTATLLGPVARGAGYVGNGVSLDGSSDAKVQVPMSPTLAAVSGAFTLEAWVYPTDVGTVRPILDRHDGALMFSLSQAKPVIFAMLNGNGYQLYAPSGVSLNAWTHVAATYDGSNLRLFINGIQVASVAATGSLPATLEPYWLGKPWWSTYAGRLDEIRIYRTALGATDIATDMTTPVDHASPFAVSGKTPAAGALGVLTTPVTASFSLSAQASTLTPGTFELRDSANAVVPASVSYDAQARRATVTPTSALQSSSTYTARVIGGQAGVRERSGAALAADVTWTFTTASSPAAPVAAYGFSESSGAATADASGNGNTATLLGPVTRGSGYFGNGVSLDGASDAKVQVPMSETLAAISSAFTLEAWVYATDVSTTRPIIDRHDMNLLFYLEEHAKPVIYAVLDGTVRQLTAPSGVSVNTWTHVAATYDGAGIRLFINAVQVASAFASGSLPATGEPFWIGRPYWNTFAGVLDEIRIYRTALNASDIAADMSAPADTNQTVISFLSPATGPVGQAVTISGLNFGNTQGSTTVTFNGTPASATSWTSTSIVAAVPSGATTGPVVVAKQGIASNGATFTVMPAITSLNPTSGPAGQAVVITGTNFGATQGSSSVTFNGTATTVSSWSATNITATVPSGLAAGAAPVVVTVNGLTSNAVNFSVVIPQPLTITATTPAAGALGVFTPPTVTFGGDVNVSTLTAATFSLIDPSGNVVAATVSYSTGTRTATLTPNAALTPLANYTVRVTGGGAGVRSSDGGGLASDIAWTFRTAADANVASAAYAFTVQSFTTEPDMSGNANTATYVNGPGWSRAGRFGPTVAFNASTARIQIPVTQTLTFTNGVTFEAWISPTTGGGQLWQQQDAGGTPLYALTVQADRTLSFVATIGGQAYALSTPAAAPASAWTHIAVTYDGTMLRLYVNGVEAASTAASGSLLTSTQPIAVGTGVKASVDEIRIYRRALAVSEIATDMTTAIEPRGPSISTLSQTSGVPGQPITINGDFFNAVQDGSTVAYNGTPVAVTSWSNISISAIMPNVVESGSFVVTVGGQTSNPRAFTLLAAPSISSLGPTSGAAGGPVTINGSNFGIAQFASTVTFNGRTASVITWSNASIQVSVPVGAASGPVVVTVGPRSSNGVNFTAAPYIMAFTAASGTAGDSLTVSGLNFGPVQGSSTIKFNGTSATVTSWSNASMTVTVPSNAGGAEQVVVAVGTLTSNVKTFWVAPSPVITTLTPTASTENQVVGIAGLDFGATQGSSTVTLNGLPATITSWSQNAIIATVPLGATTGPVVVTVNGRASNGATFTVRPANPLAVTAHFSPAAYGSGWYGAGVTITFTCSTDPMYTVTVCPFSTTVFQEGPGQVVARTATDSAGNQTTIALLVNVDLTNPTLSVTSPSAFAVFPPDTTSVVIGGTARDSLSGLQSVTCGGAAATVTSTTYVCNAAVVDGTNTVHVVATDNAGHTTSKDVTVTVGDIAPTALTISPARMTLAPGWGQQLTVTDQYYRVVTGGAWTSSNSAIAEVVVDNDNASVHALAVGTTTVTLTRGSLTAQATVTVAAFTGDGPTLPPGTSLWELSPSPQGDLNAANLGSGTFPFQRGEVLRAVPADASNTAQPGLFFVEHSLLDTFTDDGHGNNTNPAKNTWPTRVRATTIDGRELWTYTPPTPARQVAVDDLGGVVLNLGRLENIGYDGSREHAIQRVSGIGGGVVWEYTPAHGRTMITELAIHPSGTIFFVENAPYLGSDSSQVITGAQATLVALNGATGGTIGLWPLYNTASGPIVREDGTVVLETVRQGSADWSLWLVTLDPGTLTPAFTMVNTDGLDTIAFYTNLFAFNQRSALAHGTGRYHLVPDGHGGYLLPIGIGDSGGANYHRTMIYRVDETGTMLNTHVQINQGSAQLVVGEDAAWALVQEPRATVSATPAFVTAFDPVTLNVVSTQQLLYDTPSPAPIGVLPTSPNTNAYYTGPHQRLCYATAGGGVLYAGPREGSSCPITPGVSGVGSAARSPGVYLSDAPSEVVTIKAGSFPQGAGNRLGMRDLQMGILLTGEPVSKTAGIFGHHSVWLVPRNQVGWLSDPEWGWAFSRQRNGVFYATVAAESHSNDCSGLLVKRVDDSEDADPPKLLFSERLSYREAAEDTLIRRILEATVYNYGDSLPYACLPEVNHFPEEYNSNSWAHGLLDATGIPALSPNAIKYPGWSKPVPTSEFLPH